MSCSFRADIQNHVAFFHFTDQLGCRFSIFCKGTGNDHIFRQRNVDLQRDFPGSFKQVMLTQGFTHRVTRCRQEGIGDTTTDNQLIADFRQGIEHIQFGGHFGTADNGHDRLGRVIQRFTERFQLFRQQRAGTGLTCKPCHTMSRGLGAVRGAKRIHYKDIAQRCVLAGQRLVVFFLAFVKAYILEQHHFAIGDFDAIKIVLDQTHRLPQQLAQMIRHRLQ